MGNTPVDLANKKDPAMGAALLAMHEEVIHEPNTHNILTTTIDSVTQQK